MSGAGLHRVFEARLVGMILKAPLLRGALEDSRKFRNPR